MANLLKFQETFPEKFLVSGFGADSPNIQCSHKKHGNAVLFYFFVICWNCRSKLCFKVLFVKSTLKIRKNFHQTHHFILAKLLSFQRTFPEKSFGRGLGRKPQLTMPTKKHGVAVLFIIAIIYWNCVPNLALRGFLKKPLKNPQKLSYRIHQSILAKNNSFSLLTKTKNGDIINKKA